MYPLVAKICMVVIVESLFLVVWLGYDDRTDCSYKWVKDIRIDE